VVPVIAPLRGPLPRGARWVMNSVAVAMLGWIVYCLVAWATHSGIWRITWELIASHQRGKPDGRSIAFISMIPGFALVLVVSGTTYALLRRRQRDP
jgi:hypothetical protein